MRNAFIKKFIEIASKNEKIILISADIGAIVFDEFRLRFPDRYINAGVSEANMIGVASGLAMTGKIPYVYTIVPFVTMRCFEQIRVDVCIQNMGINIIGVGGGLVYSTLGPTHHAIEDIAIMRALPNMTVIVPADPIEAALATQALVNYGKPAYLRIGTAGEPNVYKEADTFEIGKAKILEEGNDGVLIACGNFLYYALEIAKILRIKGISLRVVNMHTIKPLDSDIILDSLKKTDKIFTYEEHSIIGGLGSAVAEIVSEHSNKKFILKRFGIDDRYFFNYGSREDLYRKSGLMPDQITKEILKYY